VDGVAFLRVLFNRYLSVCSGTLVGVNFSVRMYLEDSAYSVHHLAKYLPIVIAWYAKCVLVGIAGRRKGSSSEARTAFGAPDGQRVFRCSPRGFSL